MKNSESLFNKWKEELFGIRSRPTLDKGILSNMYAKAKIEFVTPTPKAQKYDYAFGGMFYVLCAQIAIYPKQDIFPMKFFNNRWVNQLKSHAFNAAAYNQIAHNWHAPTNAPFLYYELMFVKSFASNRWYLLECTDIDRSKGYGNTSIKLFCEVEEDFYIWEDNGEPALPKIGCEMLEQAMDYAEDAQAMKNSLSTVIEMDMKEAKQKQEQAKKKEEEDILLNSVRDGFVRHLSQTLFDRNLAAADEDTKERLISLVAEGTLELESIDMRSLDVNGLIDEISNRIPEDQQQPFRERAKEVLDAHIKS